MRKDSGFEVTDKIILYLTENKTLSTVFEKHLTYIKQETLIDKVVLTNELLNGEEIAFDNVKTIVKLEKI